MPTAPSTGIDDTTGQFSLRDILTTVFKWRAMIVVFTLSVLFAVTVSTILKPRVYEVTATLLVNSARAEIPLAPKESSQLIINRISEQDLNTEIEILKSRSLI